MNRKSIDMRRKGSEIRRKSSEIRRKSSDIKLAMVAALAIKNQHTDENLILKHETLGSNVPTSVSAARKSSRRVSFKQTPISEEEAVHVRRGSVLAARAFEKITVHSTRIPE